MKIKKIASSARVDKYIERWAHRGIEKPDHSSSNPKFFHRYAWQNEDPSKH
jgi:hypothetical protein